MSAIGRALKADRLKHLDVLVDMVPGLHLA